MVKIGQGPMCVQWNIDPCSGFASSPFHQKTHCNYAQLLTDSRFYANHRFLEMSNNIIFWVKFTQILDYIKF